MSYPSHVVTTLIVTLTLLAHNSNAMFWGQQILEVGEVCKNTVYDYDTSSKKLYPNLCTYNLPASLIGKTLIWDFYKNTPEYIKFIGTYTQEDPGVISPSANANDPSRLGSTTGSWIMMHGTGMLFQHGMRPTCLPPGSQSCRCGTAFGAAAGQRMGMNSDGQGQMLGDTR